MNEIIKTLLDNTIRKEDFDEYFSLAKSILNNPEYQKRLDFSHHGKESVIEHSIKVSYVAFKLSKKFKLNIQDAVTAGLLHDFYNNDWTITKNTEGFFKAHGFTHAKIARKNAKKYFPELVNPHVEDAIAKHMFPLNIKPPKYTISWVVTASDKWVSLRILKNFRELPSYLGIRPIKKSNKK